MSNVPHFRHSFEVPEDDIDYLGHASNIAYIRWVQDAAVAHSASVGWGVDAYLRTGAVFVIARHEVDYLRPVLRGERVEARTWLTGVMAAKCQRATELVRVSAEDEMPAWTGEPEADKRRVLARAVTTWAFIELATGRPRRIPGELKVAFGWTGR